MILVNTCLPASSWRVIAIQSPGITAVDFFWQGLQDDKNHQHFQQL
jgi:hypothetical protein